MSIPREVRLNNRNPVTRSSRNLFTYYSEQEYNAAMSAQLPDSGMKMYAELKRKCQICKTIKVLNEFHRDRTTALGYSYKCKSCKLEYNKTHIKKDTRKRERKEYEFTRGLRRNYKMSTETYNFMFQEQESKCACCGKHQDHCKRRLAVDHDHETGQIRALICDNCNPGLGYFKHSIQKLEQAIEYLKKFQK